MLLLFTACGKNGNDASITDMLTSHYWNFYQSKIITYDSTATGYVLKDETSDSAIFCKVINYEFSKDHNFKTHSTCTNIGDSIGKWSLSTDSILSAFIPQTVLGQTYYIGINGKISEIDFAHFVTISYQVVYSYPTIHKDSIVTISTYRN